MDIVYQKILVRGCNKAHHRIILQGASYSRDYFSTRSKREFLQEMRFHRLLLKTLFPLMLLFISAGRVTSSKILAYFPFPAYSHHRVFQPILHELANRGHKIDYVSPFNLETGHPNITHLRIRDYLRDTIDRAECVGFEEQLRLPMHTLLLQNNRFTIEATKAICSMEPVQRLIRSDAQYDLVIHSGPFLQEHAGVLCHKFKAPGVAVIASPTISVSQVTGLPDNPSYVVDTKLAYPNRMSFFQRLHNSYSTWLTALSHYLLMYQTQGVVDECFKYPGWEQRPPMNELASDNALILVNSPSSLGFPYPTAPHVKMIEGVNILPNKALPEDLDNLLSNAPSGVIYFSFGSIVDFSNVLGNEAQDIFARAFSRMNETVLWKCNGGPWPGMPQNIRVAKWFPQQDILAHKNVKLFLTHGGLISLFESLNHAVPVLVFPIFSDQAMNAQRVVDSGIGRRITLSDVNEDLLVDSMRQILDSPSYAREIERRSAMLKDRALEPVAEAAYWIEYVLRHGRVLQPAALKLTFFQLHQWDVFTFIAALLALIYFCFKCIFGRVFRQKPPGFSSSPKEKIQ